MKLRTLLVILVVCAWAPFSRALARQAGTTPAPFAGLSNPQPGQALQGTVAIIGQIPAESFQSAELSFNYSGADLPSWFPIAEFRAPATGEVAQWDTTLLTDGIYDLRLLVTLTDGRQLVSMAPGLRVRNYTPIETDTPPPPTQTSSEPDKGPSQDIAGTPDPAESTPDGTSAPLHLPPTPLPTNPAQLPTAEIVRSLGRGGLAVVGIFAFLALYVMIKRDRG